MRRTLDLIDHRPIQGADHACRIPFGGQERQVVIKSQVAHLGGGQLSGQSGLACLPRARDEHGRGVGKGLGEASFDEPGVDRAFRKRRRHGIKISTFSERVTIFSDSEVVKYGFILCIIRKITPRLHPGMCRRVILDRWKP